VTEAEVLGDGPQRYCVEVEPSTVAAGENCPLTLLARASGLSRTALKSAATKGAVWLQTAPRAGGGRDKPRRLRRLNRVLRAGERIYFNYHAVVLAAPPATARLLFDGGDYSVWLKPAGMRCQGSKWGDHNTLYRYAETQLLPRRTAFIVHRLDRMTAGLVLLAHNKKSAAVLAEQFAARRVKKVYRAVVNGEPEMALPLRIDQPLEGKSAVTVLLSSQLARQGLPSLTDVSSPVSLPTGFSLLTLSIETGRKHQIRRHLAALGHPILGDRRYTAGDSQSSGHEVAVDLQLQAVSLSFCDPASGERKQFSMLDKSVFDAQSITECNNDSQY